MTITTLSMLIMTEERGIRTPTMQPHVLISSLYFFLRTRSNRSGGIQGGISNGENIVGRVCFKPTSTIGKEQNTVSRAGRLCF
jgi:chorismate synthase